MHAALIVDLDGVLRHWTGQQTAGIERRHGLPAGSLTAVAFAPERLRAAVTGQVSDGEWRAGIAEELTRRHGAGGRAAVGEWSAPVGEVDPDVLRLVRAQRRRRTVALLSNATDRLGSDLRALALDREFDAVFNSAGLGWRSPTRRSSAGCARRSASRRSSACSWTTPPSTSRPPRPWA